MLILDEQVVHNVKTQRHAMEASFLATRLGRMADEH